jgi:hypothetical protein
VWIHLVASEPLAVLERRPMRVEGRGDLAGVEGWEAICVAPCRALVHRDERLRVGGTGVEPIYFYVPEGPGPFKAYADTGSAANQTAGIVLMITGAALMLIGGVTTIILETGPTKNAADDSPEMVLLHASVTSLILGGVIFGIGIPFRAAGTGDIKIEPARAGPGRSAPAAAHGPRLDLGAGLYLTPRGLEF